MKPGPRAHRDSTTGKIHKTPFVNSNKRAPVRRARAATFVQDEHVSRSKAKAMSGTLNPVTRTKLKPGAPNIVSSDGTVYVKRHDDQDAPAQYAVASTRLARLVGMPNLIAHNAFSRINGVEGIAAGRVAGAPLVSFENKRERKFDADMKRDLADHVKAEQLLKRGNKYYARSAEVYQWADYTDPRIQKGFSDLQLFDALTGQTDRHGGNIYLDPATGAVVGIDDDHSFGLGQSAGDVVGQYKKAKYAGLPALVDETTADAILELSLDALRDELAERPGDLRRLTDQEIDDAVTRLDTVQTYLQGLKDRGELVSVWDDETYRKAQQDPVGNYLGRQLTGIEQGLAGTVLGKGGHKEVTLRVAGAPPGATTVLPASPPVAPPQWTAQQPTQQVRNAPNLLTTRRIPAPPRFAPPPQQIQPRSARVLAAMRFRAEQGDNPSPTSTPPNERADSPRNAATTRLLADDEELLPGVDDSFTAPGGFTLVTLSPGDEIYSDEEDQ